MPRRFRHGVAARRHWLSLPSDACGRHAAAEPKGFLETIKRHSLVTSTVPANGDQNPYAIVVAPVTAGKIQEGRRAGRQLQRPQQSAGPRHHHRQLHTRDEDN